MIAKMKSNVFSNGELEEWWKKLQDNTGDRAELRRCDSSIKVVQVPFFYELHRNMASALQNQYQWEDRLAMVAGLASHIDHTPGKTLSKQMAALKGARPCISELRFRRILQRNRADLYVSLIRILKNLPRSERKSSLAAVDLYDLASSVFYWGDEVRKRWAYEYFPSLNN